MNISTLMPQSLLMKVFGVMIAAGIAIGSLLIAIHHFESIGYERRVSEDEIGLNKDLVQAQTQTLLLQHQLNEAQNALSKAKSDLLAINTVNRNAVNGLRVSNTSFNSGLPTDTREALSRRIASLSSVVEDCSARLVEVANDADIAIAEVNMLESAWAK